MTHTTHADPIDLGILPLVRAERVGAYTTVPVNEARKAYMLHTIVGVSTCDQGKRAKPPSIAPVLMEYFSGAITNFRKNFSYICLQKFHLKRLRCPSSSKVVT